MFEGPERRRSNEGYKGDDRRDDRCSAETCQYHILTNSIIKDLKEAVSKLIDGQLQMRDTVVQLTEGFKTMDRIDKKLEKIEDNIIVQFERSDRLREEKDKEQDIKIDNLKGFMYKVSGIGVAASFIIGSIIVPLLVIFL